MRKEDKVKLRITDSKTKKRHKFDESRRQYSENFPRVIAESFVLTPTDLRVVGQGLCINSMLSNPIVRDTQNRLFG
ncbi:MAG: hypothetical protein GY714_18030 [Desulfobacterales bacterium]|nr:hypothetical protein [Desulfobacterales bacterium]